MQPKTITMFSALCKYKPYLFVAPIWEPKPFMGDELFWYTLTIFLDNELLIHKRMHMIWTQIIQLCKTIKIEGNQQGV